MSVSAISPETRSYSGLLFPVMPSARSVPGTCAAACSVTSALFGSLLLHPAATEGGAVPDLFSFLLRWRSTHCIWTIAGGVHPPAGRSQKIRMSQRGCAGCLVRGLDCRQRVEKNSHSVFVKTSYNCYWMDCHKVL